jgi:hypothetical protein
MDRAASESRKIWAITSYFNPSKYKRRSINYRQFLARLCVPLVTVELSFDGSYELGSDDADVLIQIPASTVLWHKESLLNVALSKVPADVPHIAWLDCDIWFERQDWVDAALVELQTHRVIQLFADLRHLNDAESLQPDDHARAALERPATALGSVYVHGRRSAGVTSFAPDNRPLLKTPSFGIAWAADAALLRHHSFYDAMIIGSGDRAMACAALGTHKAAIARLHLSPERAAHYLRWALPYFAAVQGKVGYIPGSVFHLWHGNLEDRYYKVRHRALAQLDFIPDRDLERERSGVWRWRNPPLEVERFFQQYFDARMEDGYVCPSTSRQ